MIAKNIKGKSFGGTVRYVLNDGHELLAAEGVFAGDEQSIIRSFAIQRSNRSEVKQPVGHIPISFSPEDSPRLTDEFMVQLAREYMEAMGIRNTQYVVVRHHNTPNDHVHIVYNRIDNDLKLISVNHDYQRNVKVCKRLKDKHKLTYGEGKEKVRREKLNGPDKVKYEIHDTIKELLPYCTGYSDLEDLLSDFDISVQYKYRSGATESPENIQGVSFRMDGIAFKGSEIDRQFSHANLQKAFEENRKPKLLTPEEQRALDEFDISKYIPDTSAFSSQKPAATAPAIASPKAEFDISKYVDDPEPAAKPVQPQAAVPPKEPSLPESKPTQSSPKSPESPPSSVPAPNPKSAPLPEPARKNPVIGGIELTDEQDKTLRDGGYIFLQNMHKKDGSGQFSAYVFLNDEKKKAFFSNDDPDKMVDCGGITIRMRDKILVEKGQITKAKMKWWGGIDFQYPFVWKDPISNEAKHSFSDPRIPKEIHDKELDEFRKSIQQKIPSPQKKGPVHRH